METAYLYYAFISYKHADAKYAIWLQKKLQNYRLPAKLKSKPIGSRVSLNGQDTVPSRLSPIFRDQTDLIPGQLEESITNALARSKYLIVICSRKAREESQYLDIEIRAFLESGHTPDQIIPLIVDTDCQHPERECFPPELQKINAQFELLGANIGDNGKNDAFLKIVANMLGVQMAEVKNLDTIRRRRNAALSAAAALAVLAICIGGFRYWWVHIAEHTDHYMGYVLEHNAAKGVAPIEKADLENYAKYYRIKTIDGKVQSVEYLNYGETLIPVDATVFNQGASKITYSYTDAGSLHMAKYFSYRGEPIVCYQYSPDGTHVTMIQDETSGISGYASANAGQIGALFSDKTFITRYVQELDERGRITRRQFAYGEDYTPCADEDYVFGYDFVYDDVGNVIKMTYLGTAEGAPTGNVDGVNAIAYTYAPDYPWLLTQTNLDIHGEMVAGPDNWAKMSYLWNTNNDVQTRELYDAQEGLVLCPDGYAAVMHNFDGVKKTATHYYGVDGQPANNAYGYATEVFKTDEKGRVVFCQYLDTTGAPAVDISTGVYGYQWEFVSETEHVQSFLDEAGNLMNTVDGFAVRRTIVDAYQYPLECYYYNSENQLCTDRYASCSYEYDEIYHQVTQWRFFDENGEPTIGLFGCAAVISEFDAKGYSTGEYFLDEAGDLVSGTLGWAKRENKLVQTGNQTDEYAVFYDANGEPYIHPTLGAAGYACLRDEQGRILAFYYLADQDIFCINEKYGYGGCGYTYDEFGRVCQTVYYNEYGFPMQVDGAVYTTYLHDEYGHTLMIAFYDAEGEPMINEVEGYAARTFTYDEEGILVDVDTFSVDNGAYFVID